MSSNDEITLIYSFLKIHIYIVFTYIIFKPQKYYSIQRWIRKNKETSSFQLISRQRISLRRPDI